MTRKKAPRNEFAKALKTIRSAKHLSQEDFGIVSSRTYVSSLERGNYSPTLNKVDELAEVLGVHPLVLLSLAYTNSTKFDDVSSLLAVVDSQIKEIY